MPRYQPYFDALAKRSGTSSSIDPALAQWYSMMPAAGTYFGMAPPQVPMLDQNKLLSSLYRESQEGRAANEMRREEIKGGYQTRLSDALSTLTGMGQQAQSDIERSYGDLATKQRQRLRQRGLANTSTMGSAELGVEREKQGAMGRLNETLRGQQLGYQTQLSGDLLSFLERIDEPALSMTDLAALAMGMGGSGSGASGLKLGSGKKATPLSRLVYPAGY